jgi:hypothetical protein
VGPFVGVAVGTAVGVAVGTAAAVQGKKEPITKAESAYVSYIHLEPAILKSPHLAFELM